VLAVSVCLTGLAAADSVGFSAAEGYDNGPLAGQPGSGSVWNVDANGGSNIFNVGLAWPAPHPDLVYIYISGVHGPSSEPTAGAYANKRMIPLSGAFEAGYSFHLNGQEKDYQQTNIALGQDSNANWGPYLGANKLSDASLAAWTDTGWTELVSGLQEAEWYNVEIVGNTATGEYDLTLYQEDLRSDTDPSQGRILQAYDINFRGNPTELAYVMLTNDGSGKDTGAYSHRYDDLYLTPEPASLGILAVGALAMLKRRRKR
jgi:hypothetical protein